MNNFRFQIYDLRLKTGKISLLIVRRRFYLSACLVFIPLLLLSGWSMPSFWRKRKANNLYSMQEYPKALDIYQDLQIDDPDKAEINYNRGNALYRLERYDEAREAFQKSLKSKKKEILKKAYYNLGNTLYRQDELEEAVKSYEQVLKMDSTDEDAVYNIEFIKNKLQKKKDQEPQQSEEKDKKNKQKQGAGQEQGKKEDKEKEKSGDKKKQSQDENKEKKPVSKGEKDTSDVADEEKSSPEEKMKKEQAKQILDALKQDEKKLKQQLYQKEEFNKQEEKVEYDW